MTGVVINQCASGFVGAQAVPGVMYVSFGPPSSTNTFPIACVGFMEEGVLVGVYVKNEAIAGQGAVLPPNVNFIPHGYLTVDWLTTNGLIFTFLPNALNTQVITTRMLGGKNITAGASWEIVGVPTGMNQIAKFIEVENVHATAIISVRGASSPQRVSVGDMMGVVLPGQVKVFPVQFVIGNEPNAAVSSMQMEFMSTVDDDDLKGIARWWREHPSAPTNGLN